MSKPPVQIPPPPEGVEISPVPNMTLAQAAQWINDVLGLPFTERALVQAANRGQLRWHYLLRRRYVSTEACYEFVLNAPSSKMARTS